MKIDVSETGSEAGGTCYCLVSCSKLELRMLLLVS